MKKRDLKTGMYVQFEKSSEIRLVMLKTSDGDCTVAMNAKIDYDGFERLIDHYSLDRINEDLELISGETSVLGNVNKIWSTFGRLLWERKEAIPELTMEEVIEKIGYEIKIKK